MRMIDAILTRDQSWATGPGHTLRRGDTFIKVQKVSPSYRERGSLPGYLSGTIPPPSWLRLGPLDPQGRGSRMASPFSSSSGRFLPSSRTTPLTFLSRESAALQARVRPIGTTLPVSRLSLSPHASVPALAARRSALGIGEGRGDGRALDSGGRLIPRALSARLRGVCDRREAGSSPDPGYGRRRRVPLTFQDFARSTGSRGKKREIRRDDPVAGYRARSDGPSGSLASAVGGCTIRSGTSG